MANKLHSMSRRVVSKLLLAGVASCLLSGLLSSCGKGDADSSNKIRIGAILPLTGSEAAVGGLMRQGLQSGLESRPNKQIELVFEDSQATPKVGVSAYQKLVQQDGIKIIMAGYSVICNVLVPFAERDDVLFIGIGTVIPDLPKDRPNVMRFYPTAQDFAGTICSYASKHYVKAAVLAVNNEHGQSSKKVFSSGFNKGGREIVFSEDFSTSDSDVATLVDKLASKDPECVFLVGHGSGYLALLKSIRERLPDVEVFTDVYFSNPSVIKAAGEAAEGVIFTTGALTGGHAESEKAQRFLTEYLEKFGEEPSLNMFINHDLMEIISESVSATDGSPEAVRDYIISNCNDREGLIGKFSFDKEGDAHFGSIALMRVKNGMLEMVTE